MEEIVVGFGAAVVDGVDDPADPATPLTMWMVCYDWILYTDIRSSSYSKYALRQANCAVSKNLDFWTQWHK